MEQTEHNFSENINEVIKPGEDTDFVFFVRTNNGGLTQKVLPAFMRYSFVNRFGEDVPNQIEFNHWYSQEQAKISNKGSFADESLLG
jgi:hypothetical protein